MPFTVAIISIFIAIFVYLPVFGGYRWNYPVQYPDEPTLETFVTSIFIATFDRGNPIGLLESIFAILTAGMAIVSIVFRRKKYGAFLSLSSYLLFAFILIFGFVAMLYCVGYST